MFKEFREKLLLFKSLHEEFKMLSKLNYSYEEAKELYNICRGYTGWFSLHNYSNDLFLYLKKEDIIKNLENYNLNSPVNINYLPGRDNLYIMLLELDITAEEFNKIINLVSYLPDNKKLYYVLLECIRGELDG